MKKFVYLLIILIVLCLTGCTVSGSFDYEYKYFDKSIGRIENGNDSDIYVIKTNDDINLFKENAFNDKFLQSLNKYNESYFENKYLIIVILHNKAANSEYKLINSNVENGILTIEIQEKLKSVSDDSLINKAFIIEVDNEEQYFEIKTSMKK